MMARISLSIGLLAFCGSLPSAAIDLALGDVVVLDPSKDAVVRVRPGDYDAGNPLANQAIITQGGNVKTPHDVAIGDGEIFVTDRSDEVIIRVDLATGTQTLVPLQSSLKPRGIALDSQGMLLVGDALSFNLVQVDPGSGAVVNLSPSISLNPALYIALGSGDAIYILESGQGLQRIDVAQQTATTVGDGALDGIAFDPATGDLFSAGSANIFRYVPGSYTSANPTANRSSVFDDDANDVAVLPGGDLVATNAGNVDLLRINPVTKDGTTVANGGNLLIPSGLAVVVPEPVFAAAAVASLATLARLGVLAARSRRRVETPSALSRAAGALDPDRRRTR
jgi:streptogramin lyase